jgi:putative SbcD/Mre11-related phosphoesterase
VLVHRDWLLTPQRAAVHVPTATAVVADLHLGYSEARCRAGEAVPLPDLGRVLAPLARVAERHGARRLVVAGDLFESSRIASLAEEFAVRLRAMGLELTAVVPGNHDRRLVADDTPLPLRPDGVDVGGWRVVHGDAELPTGPAVFGHFHPWLRWSRGVEGPCYLVAPDRLVLPAFSADAAGVNVLRDRRWRAYRCCVTAGEKVLDFGELRALARRRVSRPA